jgi:hypothetical protein
MQTLLTSKMRLTGFAAVLLAVSSLPMAAHATPITLVGNLLGANENPGNNSLGTGLAVVIIDPAANTMRVEVNFSGLFATTATGAASGVTASHIHCCEATPGANANVMVATTTPTFPGFPLGVTSGTYDQTFDLTQASSYNPAFITSAFDPTHDVAGAEAALINGLENGETYLNIHTTRFPGGEIRAPLRVPEPASLAMFGIALAAFAGMFRFGRRQITRPA